MRTKLWSLVTIVFFLASGCSKQSGTSKPFDVTQAMQMVYSNYDVKTQTSAALLPEYEGVSQSDTEKQMTVRAVLSTFSVEAGVPIFILVTSANPPNYDCHACAPTIGMAVFSQKGPKWEIAAFNRAVTYAGGWGQPPVDIQLVQIGRSRHAVQVKNVSGGQGEATAILELLIPWNGTITRGLRRVVSDAYACGDGGGGLPCYANERTVKFIASGKAEYYDLQVELTGTDLVEGNGTPMRAQEVHGTEMLKFEKGKYVQVSRQGDITMADRNLLDLDKGSGK